jgi:hypothetical protein
MNFTWSHNTEACRMEDTRDSTLRVLFSTSFVEPYAVCLMKVGREIEPDVQT